MNGLSGEEKEKIKADKLEKQREQAKKKREENKNKPKPTKKEEKPEFPYIDEVPKEQLEGKHIFIDPGKRSLFSMMDDEGNFFPIPTVNT